MRPSSDSASTGGHHATRAAALLLLVAGAGCKQVPADTARMREALGAIAATSAATSGEVQVKRRQNAYWEPATLGTVFWPGDWVRTGRDGWVRVEFLPGGGLELDGEAVAIIEAPEPAAPGEAPEARVAVEAGVVRGFIAGQDAEGRPQALRIRDADGAEARLAAAEGEEAVEVRLARTDAGTEIAVDSGRATLAVEGDRHDLEPGIGATFARSGVQPLRLLPGARVRTPAADARLRFDPAGEVRLAWRAVSGAAGYRIQIARDPDFRSDARVVEADGTRHELLPDEPGRWVFRVAARDADGRYGPYGPPRRLFLEADTPRDHLLEPAPDARFGHSGDAADIRFSWDLSQAIEYRLLVSATPDLEAEPVVDQVVLGDTLEIDSLEPGTWYWGVYEADGDEMPLHLRPRAFTVRAVPVRTPRVIRDWGPGR